MSARELPTGWLRLGEADDVVVLTAEVAAGELLQGPHGEPWVIRTPLGIGHKLAARAIAPGEVVHKYGFPIGVATAPIPAGAHVHTHNLRSAHIPFERRAEA
jgi:altronate hydrolase